MSHFTIPTNSVNPIDAMHRVSRQSETNVCYTGVRSGMAAVRLSELTGLDMWGVGVAILAIWVRLQFTPFLLAQCVECLPLRLDHTYCDSFLNTSITPTSVLRKMVRSIICYHFKPSTHTIWCICSTNPMYAPHRRHCNAMLQGKHTVPL